MYCDFSPHLFNKSKSEETNTRKRLVESNSTNQEGINYAHDINKQLLHHNIYEQSDTMLQQAKSGCLDKNQLLYQLSEMDLFVTATMLNAEKKHCKKKDPVLWTPDIYQSNLRVQYYNIRLKSECHRIYARKRLKQIVSNMDDNSKKILRSNTKHL
jgi:hypothetical protein